MNSDGKSNNQQPTVLSRIVDLFLRTDLAPIVIGLSLIFGVIAVFLTPREEEPQIVVPMADIHVFSPGLAVEEIERQITTRLEKILSQIDGVEHVYSVTMPGHAVVTVRFYVGENREASLVKIYNKIYSNIDIIPPDVESWVVKPVEIDDVPIVNISLWSDNSKEIDDYALRRIAEEVEIQLQAIPQTNRIQVIGGRKRALQVYLDSDALAAQRTSVLDVVRALQISNVRKPAGAFDQGNLHITVDVGDFFGGVEELRRSVVNIVDGRTVFLKDVARVFDGPAEQTSYTWIGFGPADIAHDNNTQNNFFPTVHIAVAKQKGSNAVWVADRIKARIEELAKTHFPAGVHARITRDYGETSNAKINELLKALGVALIIVIGLITYTLGWREGLIVATAVPISFSLTLLVNYLAGYTINRVTLFALILSLGLVVDDPIVDIENIFRHLRMRLEPPLQAVSTAVNEVRPPILLATLAVIFSFLPLTLITGMMGPYMRPMALNVPVAMIMSMVVAFMVTPWLAYKSLKDEKVDKPSPISIMQTRPYQIYTAVLGPLLDRGVKAWGLLLLMCILFFGACTLAVFRLVPLKMLPFDNKNELQILVNPPEGTTLEQTDAITRQLSEVLRNTPEVLDFETYAGLSSAMDFNGMTRHYYLRNAPHVADIRVNLVHKEKREMQSHAIGMRLRQTLEAIAKQSNTRIAIIETPPGPPVLSTITAEIYGKADVPYERLRSAARTLENRLQVEIGVSDVDSTVEDNSERLLFLTDKEKAALSGVSVSDIAQTTALSLGGFDVSRMHLPGEINPLPIRLLLPRETRSDLDRLRALVVKGQPGIAKIREVSGVRDAPVPIIRLGELGMFEKRPMEKAIYHKDLKPVVFVYAEAVGRAPAEIAADIEEDRRDHITPQMPVPPQSRPLAQRNYLSNGSGIPWSLPEGTRVSWLGEGELNITRDVFRDLGIAFAAALICIYFILIYQTKSYSMPLVLMISIPLSLIGILPGFWMLNHIVSAPVSGYSNQTFFTATGMIGMIAVSGLAVRNAILLIEFLDSGLSRGLPLREAILEAGAVRTRAILLTSATAMLSAIPIAFDPVFSGLAWALIFGLFVSTVFTLFVVPVAYDLMYRNRPCHGLPINKREQDLS